MIKEGDRTKWTITFALPRKDDSIKCFEDCLESWSKLCSGKNSTSNEGLIYLFSYEEKTGFIVYNNHPELNSLRSFCVLHNRNYILVETTGQNDIQPLDVRVQQHLDVINYLLNDYNMI